MKAIILVCLLNCCIIFGFNSLASSAELADNKVTGHNGQSAQADSFSMFDGGHVMTAAEKEALNAKVDAEAQPFRVDKLELVAWGTTNLTKTSNDLGLKLSYYHPISWMGNWKLSLGPMVKATMSKGSTDTNFDWKTGNMQAGAVTKLDKRGESIKVELSAGSYKNTGHGGGYSFEDKRTVVNPEVYYGNQNRRIDREKLFPEFEVNALGQFEVSKGTTSATHNGAPVPREQRDSNYYYAQVKPTVADIRVSDNVQVSPFVKIGGLYVAGDKSTGVVVGTGADLRLKNGKIGGIEISYSNNSKEGNSYAVSWWISISELVARAFKKV